MCTNRSKTSRSSKSNLDDEVVGLIFKLDLFSPTLGNLILRWMCQRLYCLLHEVRTLKPKHPVVFGKTCSGFAIAKNKFRMQVSKGLLKYYYHIGKTRCGNELIIVSITDLRSVKYFGTVKLTGELLYQYNNVVVFFPSFRCLCAYAQI